MNSGKFQIDVERVTRIRLAGALIAIFCVAGAAYLAGVRQATTSSGAAPHTYRLDLGGLHLRLSAGVLGLGVIFLLVALTGVAVYLAVVAQRRRRGTHVVQALLAGIVESSDDAIISKTLNGIITSWNDGAEKIFGYSSGEAIGQSITMLIPPEAREEERHILARIRAGGSVNHYETVRIRKDGTRVAASLTVSPIKDAKGKVVGASKILRDISERKHSENRLRAQLDQLNLLDEITRAVGERQDLRSVFQVVIRRLEDDLPIDFGCVCLYEPATATLTVTCVGVRSAALAMELAMTEHAQIPIDQNGISHCVRGQLIYEPDVRKVQFPFPQRLAQGGLCSMVAAPLLSESNVFGVLIAARHQPDGFTSGDCEFLRQLSSHVALAARHAQIYASLELAYDDLRRSQKAVMEQERLRVLGQMASGIAHDINNALSPVALYTEALLATEPGLSSRARAYLETTQRAIDDVAHTVGRLSEFYRRSEPQLILRSVDLNGSVKQVVELTRARWSDMPQQMGIVIHVRMDLEADLPLVAGIESEIREALTNLIFNAVDAMPDGGTLTLRTRTVRQTAISPETRVCVEVEDQGVGMDDETRHRCLEPFFTTKGERGSGLGLAMVFGIAQRQNAELEIESSPGIGTTVRLNFPTIPIGTYPSQIAPTRRPRSGLRILVVDDDPVILQSLRAILEADGHIVTTASGGAESLDILRATVARDERFAVVITDLGMPQVDGRKVATTVKKLCRDTPVILLTGWGQRIVAEEDVPANVDYVLNKPPRLSQLRDALVQVLVDSPPATPGADGRPI